MPWPSRWVYGALLAFVGFLCWSDPGGAGSSFQAVFGWLGSVVVAVFDFVDGLFGDGSGGVS